MEAEEGRTECRGAPIAGALDAPARLIVAASEDNDLDIPEGLKSMMLKLNSSISVTVSGMCSIS